MFIYRYIFQTSTTPYAIEKGLIKKEFAEFGFQSLAIF